MTDRGVAVLCNPGGGRVKGQVERVRRAGRAVAGDAYREAATAEEIAAAVAELAAGEPDALALVGGDGTVQAALTALEARTEGGGRPWPTLAPVAGGTANVTARDLDAGEDPLARLERLARWRDGTAEGRRVRRAVLRIRHPDVGVICGLFFGTGLAAAGVEFFREKLSGVDVTGQAMSAVALARTLWGLAFGGMERTVEPRRLEVAADHPAAGERTCLLCVAGTLERFLLRTRPYWGDGDGPIHFTLVERGPRKLWRNLPRLARGRPGRALTPEGGYHSRDVDRLELRFDGPFVVDGELFRVRAAPGAVTIDVAAEPEWLTF